MNRKRFASLPTDLNTKFVVLTLHLSDERMAIEVKESELIDRGGDGEWAFKAKGSALARSTELGEVYNMSIGWTSYTGYIIDYATKKEEAIQTARAVLEHRKFEILKYFEAQKNKFKALSGALVIE